MVDFFELVSPVVKLSLERAVERSGGNDGDKNPSLATEIVYFKVTVFDNDLIVGAASASHIYILWPSIVFFSLSIWLWYICSL